ncbi:MAG: hypothetical protein ACI4J6_07610 [Oscillospiraceae bacterium]
MTGFILFAVFMIFSAALLFLGRLFKRRREKYIDGMNRFIDRCRRFDGVVTACGDIPADREGNTVKAVVVSFRDPEMKRTVVHRYTGSGRRYDKGDRVEIYYCEETDSACIKNDNPFFRKARVCRVLCVLCRVAAAFSAIAGVVCLIIV